MSKNAIKTDQLKRCCYLEKSIQCNKCGPSGNLIYYGQRKRSNGVSVQMIQCTKCKKVYLEKMEPFRWTHFCGDELQLILRALARGTIKSTAEKTGFHTSKVQRVKKKMDTYILEMLDEAANKTGLSKKEVFELIKKNWDKG